MFSVLEELGETGFVNAGEEEGSSKAKQNRLGNGGKKN